MKGNSYVIPSNNNVCTSQPPPSYNQVIEEDNPIPTAPTYTDPNRSAHSQSEIRYQRQTIEPIEINSTSSKDSCILYWSILNLFCCLWPLGLYALIKYFKILELRNLGDHQGAQRAAKSAIKINKYSTIFGILIIIILIIILSITYVRYKTS